MIALALLGFLLESQLAIFQSMKTLKRQLDYGAAAHNAEVQLKRFEHIPFLDLPPQVLKPDRQGWLRLGQLDFDPTTLEVQLLQGKLEPVVPLHLDPVRGRIQVPAALAGQRLLVNYAYFACDRSETQRVPQSGQIDLANQPVMRVEKILQAHGEELVPFQDWLWSLESGLRLGPSARGAVLVVDYRGQNVGNRISGMFLDDSLRRQLAPSPLKLLTVRELYAGHEAFSVSAVRTATP